MQTTNAANMSEKNTQMSLPRLSSDAEAQSDHSLHDEKISMDEVVYPEGGLMGWCAVAGSWFTMFCTFGLAVAFGVFQSYYKYHLFPNQSSSTISWIGSIQLFFQFSMGAISGPLYDKGYFRALTLGGSTIFIVSFFMVSLCKEFWQVMLAQAVGTGVGIGFLFLPAVSVLSHYFLRRRSLAIGIAVTGSSVGGIVLPIMLNRLIRSHGFERAVQYTGYLLLGCLILANALIHPRLPPTPKSVQKPSLKDIFSDKAYCMLVAGLFFVAWGIFFPIFYLQIFAQQNQLGEVLITYTVAILNAASVIGRITPNFLADKFGPLNLLAIMCAGSGIMCFAVFGAGTQGGLIAVAILFGFFQGAYVSLSGPSLIATAKSFNEIGVRMGMGFFIMSFAALTGTPITGALLDRFGKTAPIVWSGMTVLTGSLLIVGSRTFQARAQKTWKV